MMGVCAVPSVVSSAIFSAVHLRLGATRCVVSVVPDAVPSALSSLFCVLVS
jgi:hypothetical protein